MNLLTNKFKLDLKVTESLNSFTKESLGKMESLLNGGKKVKDPNAPKRGKSAFFYFCDKNRTSTKTAFPTLKNHEVSKKMAENWAKLSDAEKKPFMDLANSDKERYSSEKEKFDLTKPQKKAHTPSKYQLFCDENRKALQEKHPNASFSEMSKILSQAWKDHKASSGDSEAVPEPPQAAAPVAEKPKKEKPKKEKAPEQPPAPVAAPVPVVEAEEKPKKPKKEKAPKA
jgi:hypothetical protein